MNNAANTARPANLSADFWRLYNDVRTASEYVALGTCTKARALELSVAALAATGSALKIATAAGAWTVAAPYLREMKAMANAMG